MAERKLIYADTAVEKLAEMLLMDDHEKKVVQSYVEQCMAVDAVEVVHGHNLRDHNSAFECSVCGFEDWDTLTSDTSEYNYCPNCGAKMDL